MPRQTDAVALVEARRLVEAGQYPAAENLARQVHRKDKKNVEAMALLGQIAGLLGDHREAARMLERCVNALPKNPVLHAMLAEALTAQGLLAKARQRYDRLLKIAPDYGPGLAGKAEVMRRQHEHEAGIEVLQPSIDAGREDAAIAMIYSRLTTLVGRPADGIEVAARHTDDDGITNEVRRGLHYALGQAHEKAGDYDAALASYREGNRLSGGRYDAEAHEKLIDALIETMTPETLAAVPRPAERSELPIFVVGMLRSGSTLAEQIIDAHPAAHGAGELELIRIMIANLSLTLRSRQTYPACIRDFGQNDVDTMSRGYLAEIGKLGRRAERVVDKYLDNYLHLGTISVLFPGARIVHARRNALDLCLSAFTQKLTAGSNPWANDLASMGHAYRQYERLMSHWRDVLEIPMLELDYEELVGDQESTSRKLIDFCGLEWDDRCLRYFESGRVVQTLSNQQVSQPIYNTSVGRAARFGAHLDPLREALG